VTGSGVTYDTSPLSAWRVQAETERVSATAREVRIQLMPRGRFWIWFWSLS
jgi:hypothetical protein